jgi:hypothetical protein
VRYRLFELHVTLASCLRLDTLDVLSSLGLQTAAFGQLAYQEREQEYPRTQEIAEAAHFLGRDGLIVPSARSNCTNVIVFVSRQGRMHLTSSRITASSIGNAGGLRSSGTELRDARRLDCCQAGEGSQSDSTTNPARETIATVATTKNPTSSRHRDAPSRTSLPTATQRAGPGTIETEGAPVRRSVRAGWADAAHTIAKAGDDILIWLEFGNIEDADLMW